MPRLAGAASRGAVLFIKPKARPTGSPDISSRSSGACRRFTPARFCLSQRPGSNARRAPANRDGGQSQLFRIKKEPFGVAVEQTQLLPQLVLAVAWQGLSQIFDHGAHTAHDLEIVAAIGAYLTEREMDEVFPIRRPENDPQLAGAVEYLIGSETAAPDGTEHAMQLVDGKHRSRRVVYCWRQRLDRNIDYNAKRECRILLQCPLGA